MHHVLIMKFAPSFELFHTKRTPSSNICNKFVHLCFLPGWTSPSMHMQRCKCMHLKKSHNARYVQYLSDPSNSTHPPPTTSTLTLTSVAMCDGNNNIIAFRNDYRCEHVVKYIESVRRRCRHILRAHVQYRGTRVHAKRNDHFKTYTENVCKSIGKLSIRNEQTTILYNRYDKHVASKY